MLVLDQKLLYISSNLFKLNTVTQSDNYFLLMIRLILTTSIRGDTMADEVFMFVTMTGTMAALTALLFVARGYRSRSKSNTEISNNETSSS